MVKRSKHRSGTTSGGTSSTSFQIVDENFRISYNLNNMSNSCRTIYIRGKYFIETGTAHTFSTWVKQIDRITRYTRSFLLERISQLISGGERQQAVMLWLRVCERADSAPARFWWSIVSLAWHILISGIAIYAFIDAITH